MSHSVLPRALCSAAFAFASLVMSAGCASNPVDDDDGLPEAPPREGGSPIADASIHAETSTLGADGSMGVHEAGGSHEAGSTEGGHTEAGGAVEGGSTDEGGATDEGGTTEEGGATDGSTTDGSTTDGSTTDGGLATDGGTKTDSGSCTDTCPLATGLTHDCLQRFALGANYAWFNFGTDFGGLAAWGQQGVSQNPTQYDGDLAAMRASGVSAIRWWVFPNFAGDGVTFDASGVPSGISAQTVADIQEALALAAKNDVYLVFTLFSFDGFTPTTVTSGVTIRSLAPMVTDPTQLAAVIANVAQPVAQAVAASPNADRLLGWDVINEPEWAIAPTGSAPGGQDFTPNTPTLTTVSLAQMKALIDGVVPVLKSATPNALTSVGWAAAKWSWAFDDVTSLDFNQPHIYGWVDEYWPYTQKPAQLGYPAKPTVYGEFLLASMPFSADAGGDDSATFATILDAWWNNGFAGAWGWAYSSASANLPLIQTFATSKGCSASF